VNVGGKGEREFVKAKKGGEGRTCVYERVLWPFMPLGPWSPHYYNKKKRARECDVQGMNSENE